MRWAHSSRNIAAAMAAFFVVVLMTPAAKAENTTAQILPVDPQKLVIATKDGPRSYFIEVADDASERAVGMMFRKSAEPIRAMLFDFGETRLVTMWMRNTFLPLDIVFIGEDRRIVKISANAEPLSLAIIGSQEPVRFALEFAAGAAKRDGLRVGDLVAHPAVTRSLARAPVE
jgi:uncharacterized protein